MLWLHSWPAEVRCSSTQPWEPSHFLAKEKDPGAQAGEEGRNPRNKEPNLAPARTPHPLWLVVPRVGWEGGLNKCWFLYSSGQQIFSSPYNVPGGNQSHQGQSREQDPRGSTPCRAHNGASGMEGQGPEAEHQGRPGVGVVLRSLWIKAQEQEWRRETMEGCGWISDRAPAWPAPAQSFLNNRGQENTLEDLPIPY